MRIKLKKDKQKELIFKAKTDLTWRQLADKIDINENYLKNELFKEKRTLCDKKYILLCKISKTNFDEYIIQRLDNNWGKSKGGLKSKKITKEIKDIKEDANLAEVTGIILGDGHVCEYKKGNKIRCYMIRIAGNNETDKDYIEKYIPRLFYKVFNDRGYSHFSKISNTSYFTIYGKNFVNFIKFKGINSGNKKVNNQGIPKWIKENRFYLSKCIRGLIDTDGSIHYISKNNKNIRISYTSYIPNLLNDVRNGLIELDLNPSKIIKNNQIFLSSKKDVNKYINEIGFSNQKNLNRLKILRNRMPP